MAGEDDDLPEPEIETIRNLVGEGAWKAIARLGAVVKLDGLGVQDHSVDVSTLTRILDHFNRLVRITQAHRSNLEVKRRGPITEVKGAGHLAALASVPGSYAMPLRLDPPPGEMFAASHSHNELEEVVGLIMAEGTVLDGMLMALPERIGDELVSLLKAADAGKVDLGIIALRDGAISAQVELSARTAGQRAHVLEQPQSSDAGRQVVRGSLWRIDTKHHKVAIDAAAQDDDASIVVEALFEDRQLEQLRPLLREYVEVEVGIVEQRRSYEQTARSREMRMLSVEAWSPTKDAYAAETEDEADEAADGEAESV
jgi:hypothetical protein